MNKPYIDSLTPLRGVGAVLVMLAHFQSQFFVLEKIDVLSHKVYLTVDLFFVLSGFVIMLSSSARFQRKIEARDYKTFVWRRFARIYPLHIATLSIMVLFALVKIALIGKYNMPAKSMPFESDEQSISSLILNIFLVQNWGLADGTSWNYPAWSLSCEWLVYLIFPLLALNINKTNSWQSLAGVFCSFLGYVSIVILYPSHNLSMTYDYGIFRCLSGFTGGMFLCRFYELKGKNLAVLKKDKPIFIIAFLTVAAFLIKANDLLIIALIMSLVLLAATNNGYFKKIFSHGCLQFIGRISFSIYMIHAVTMHFAGSISKLVLKKDIIELPFLANSIFLVILIMIVGIVSTISYKIFEVALPQFLKGKKKSF